MIRRLDPRDNVEYHIICDATAWGAVVGYFRGRRIHECVTDRWGRNYIFSGIIEKQRGGRYDRTTGKMGLVGAVRTAARGGCFTSELRRAPSAASLPLRDQCWRSGRRDPELSAIWHP